MQKGDGSRTYALDLQPGQALFTPVSTSYKLRQAARAGLCRRSYPQEGVLPHPYTKLHAQALPLQVLQMLVQRF